MYCTYIHRMLIITAASCQQDDEPQTLFAQEPRFNDLDREFLQSLGIKTVEHPEGFNLLTHNSFAYCPGAEQNVDLRCFSQDPVLYLGGDAKTWYDDEGNLRSRFESTKPPGYCEEWDLHPDRDRRCAILVRSFMRDRQEHALPELDRSIPIYLNWRQNTEP